MNPELLLFLAERMGLPASIGHQCVLLNGDVPLEFTPHTDRAQFADVVIWAASNIDGADVYICRNHVESFAYAERGKAHKPPVMVDHNSTPSGIMAATVEAIARAAGWEE